MSDEYFNTDFEKIELFKGETPKDIKQKCYQLCKDYLGGIWSQIDVKDIELKRISGGLSNQLYRCALSTAIRAIGDEPEVVAVRLYGMKYFNNECVGNDRHNDAIVSLIMSEHSLGPKLFGTFPQGDIQQYVKHRNFRIKEQNDPKLVSELARKLAKFHTLKVPINKNTNWLFNTIDNNMRNAYKKFPINQLLDEYNCDSLNSVDLNSELNWLRECISTIDSPICFSHNDFRANNIMVLEEIDLNSNINSDNNQILFCDFEVSGYGYRGTDLGSLFGEWNRDLNGYKTVHNFPNDSVIKPFIDEYIRESIRFCKKFSDDSRNSFQHIMKEIKVFTLLSSIFMITACLVMDESEEQPFLTKKNLMV